MVVFLVSNDQYIAAGYPNPNNGPQAGGTLITITTVSYDLVAGATVTIGGSPCSSVTIVNPNLPNKLTCITPPHSSGDKPLRLINPFNQVATGSHSFTYRGPPSFASTNPIVPTSGSTAGGGILTINGSNFGTITGTTVTIGGVNCPTILVNNGQIKCTTPPGTAGS